MEANNDPFAWQAQANCREEKTSKFFLDEMDGSHSPEAYKAICAACPVLAKCLNTALLYNFEGIWGGLTEIERRKMYPDYSEWLREELEELGEYRPLKHLAA